MWVVTFCLIANPMDLSGWRESVQPPGDLLLWNMSWSLAKAMLWGTCLHWRPQSRGAPREFSWNSPIQNVWKAIHDCSPDIILSVTNRPIKMCLLDKNWWRKTLIKISVQDIPPLEEGCCDSFYFESKRRALADLPPGWSALAGLLTCSSSSFKSSLNFLLSSVSYPCPEPGSENAPWSCV